MPLCTKRELWTMGIKDGGIRQGWNIIFMFAAGLDEEVSVEWVSAQWVTLGTLPPRLSGHRLGFVRLAHLSATAGQRTASRIQCNVCAQLTAHRDAAETVHMHTCFIALMQKSSSILQWFSFSQSGANKSRTATQQQYNKQCGMCTISISNIGGPYNSE